MTQAANVVIVQTAKVVSPNGVATNVMPSNQEIDEAFFAAIFDKAETWLKTNQPSESFRRALLRVSQTAFAGWGDVNGD